MKLVLCQVYNHEAFVATPSGLLVRAILLLPPYARDPSHARDSRFPLVLVVLSGVHLMLLVLSMAMAFTTDD